LRKKKKKFHLTVSILYFGGLVNILPLIQQNVWSSQSTFRMC
jgi:hypothetical protein